MDGLVALINASSDKLAFVGGLGFVLICIFCKEEVQVGPVQLPAIDSLGRAISGVIGVVLLSWAVFVWTASATVGVFSTPPSPDNGGLRQGQILLSTAYAGNGQRVVLQQNRPKQVRLSTGEEIGIFADSIAARGPSRLVVFQLNDKIRQDLDREVTYQSLVNRIGRQGILLEASVIQGGRYTFAGARHTVTVDQVLWYALGPDYVVVIVE